MLTSLCVSSGSVVATMEGGFSTPQSIPDLTISVEDVVSSPAFAYQTDVGSVKVRALGESTS